MSDDKKSKIDTNISAAKSLFLGNIEEGNFFPFPKVSPEEAETLRMVIDSIDKFMQGKGEQYREFDREGAQTPDYIEQLKELGLFGLIIPEDFGGIGFSNTAYSRVLQQTSRYDASTSLTIGAHSSIGMKGLLLFGSEEQKKKYLPKLASGEMIAAFCLTEAGAGSDAAAVKTTATKNADGSWSLTGEKIWITNGPIADFFTVFAKTDGEQGKMTAFIVERSFAGVSSGPKEDKMGIRSSSTSTVVLTNVKVPAENLLGEEGKGFKVAMAILNNGRTGLGGGAVGAMKELIKLSSRQA
jgi:acyl-CoA dehydrogenase family protein 9